MLHKKTKRNIFCKKVSFEGFQTIIVSPKRTFSEFSPSVDITSISLGELVEKSEEKLLKPTNL